MADVVKIEGVTAILRNLKKAKIKNAKLLEKGLVKAGLFLQRKSQQVVPVDTGNLRASAFTRKENEGLNTQVRVGYTANYAIYVHEDLEARHKVGKQAKFLEGPARRFKNEIRNIIAAEIRKQ